MPVRVPAASGTALTCSKVLARRDIGQLLRTMQAETRTKLQSDSAPQSD